MYPVLQAVTEGSDHSLPLPQSDPFPGFHVSHVCGGPGVGYYDLFSPFPPLNTGFYSNWIMLLGIHPYQTLSFAPGDTHPICHPQVNHGGPSTFSILHRPGKQGKRLRQTSPPHLKPHLSDLWSCLLSSRGSV